MGEKCNFLTSGELYCNFAPENDKYKFMENKKLNLEVMDKFIRFINTGDIDLGKSIISPDVVFYAPTSPEPVHGFQGYTAVLDMMRGAMPDVSWKAEEFIADDNKVMVRFTMTGTQTNSFMGMPARGKKVCVTAMNIYEFKDGKIIREHGLPDLFSMLIQLGAIPAPQN